MEGGTYESAPPPVASLFLFFHFIFPFSSLGARLAESGNRFYQKYPTINCLSESCRSYHYSYHS